MHEKYEGLTTAEAEKRIVKFGLNELIEQNRQTAFKIFMHQFKNFLVYLLFIAAFISAIIGELFDAIIILIILIVNALFGFIQEYKAENAIASLKKLTISHVRVIRDGQEQLIDSSKLVPGDIILVAEGDKIPADALIKESLRFEVNEAALTGESLPILKSEKDKKSNSVYMGTIVSAGRATLEIVSTGQDTKMGSMATSLDQIKITDTPLTSKISKLGKQLSIGAIIIVTILFIIGILKEHPIVDMLLTSISLFVAAVPEGLPAVITITLAVGLQRMAKRKAILRKLGAIEALGNSTIIATDKTGTLTENKMKVVELWVNKEKIYQSEIAHKTHDNTVKELIRCGVICNNAKIAVSKKEGTIVLGDQTEGSLLHLAKDNGIDPETVRSNGSILDEFSFDSHKKMMSVLWKEGNEKILYTKGAPEKVLKLSTHIYVKGKRQKITKQEREIIQKAIDESARNGLRVLALASRKVHKSFKKRDSAERELDIIGLIGIADPPRKDVREVIIKTKNAGIRTIMITGDNPLTATYIGKEVGLLSDKDKVVTGVEIAKMNDKQLEHELKSTNVYARTTPEDKYRIVTILQNMGHSVTVTGDGVNDALALKQANVGVAMGITGSDVAKEVADMVITDDNFVSIVNAVREGRIIYDNIVKSTTYLVSCNLGEVLLIFVAILLGFQSPLIPIQILWVNLVTDGLPALSLAFDPGSSGIMNKRPRNAQNTLLNRNNIPTILEYGLIVALVPLSFFLITNMSSGLDSARTVAFTSLVVTQMVVIFFLRPGQKFTSNKILLVAIGVSLGLQFIIVSFQPFISIFHISE